MTDSTLSLVTAAQKGDTFAFGQLYDRHVREIFDFCFYRVSRKEVAEDLTSTVFMKALESLKHFIPKDEHSFRGWLFTIARHAIIDHYRRQKPTVDVHTLPIVDAHGTDFVAAFDDHIDREKLQRAIQTLSESEQELLTMRVWQELPYATIAASLGKSEDAAKMQFSRAVRKLKTAVATLAVLAIVIIKKYFA